MRTRSVKVLDLSVQVDEDAVFLNDVPLAGFERHEVEIPTIGQPVVVWAAKTGGHADAIMVVPGHDPLVMQLYPAASSKLEGVIVRLDVEPRKPS